MVSAHLSENLILASAREIFLFWTIEMGLSDIIGSRPTPQDIATALVVYRRGCMFAWLSVLSARFCASQTPPRSQDLLACSDDLALDGKHQAIAIDVGLQCRANICQRC